MLLRDMISEIDFHEIGGKLIIKLIYWIGLRGTLNIKSRSKTRLIMTENLCQRPSEKVQT